MGLFFIYILKASVCLALFYLFYKVLLSKETFHRFNRMALLGTVVLSFFLPAIKIAVSEPTALNRTVSDLESLLMLAELHAEAGTTETVSRVGWQEAAVGIYLIGVVFFCLKNLTGIGRMLVLIERNRKERLADGSVLVHCTEKTAPFSWMKYIVVSEKDLQEDCTPILAHEQAHIRLRHSWDILIAQACIIVQWFNPAAWLVKQELQAVHEYEADSEVIRRGVNAKEYQLLLIKKAVGARLYSLANSLNHSSLKKRITMMIKKKSNPWARAKLLYLLPLTAAVAGIMACTDTAADGNMAGNKDTDKIVIDKGMAAPASAQSLPGDTVMDMVEKMPEFPGGMDAMMKFLKENVKYPDAAKASEAEGRVVVQFVVDKEGNVTEPTVMKSAGEVLDAEALRVVGMMPRWTPGMNGGEPVRVRYTMPFTFKMP